MWGNMFDICDPFSHVLGPGTQSANFGAASTAALTVG